MAADEVGLFAVCSCTGYVTPGLDILLARDLGMAPACSGSFVGHMGCYAALPGLGAVSRLRAARGRPAVLLCAELTSLHVQPARRDIGQIVAHALFCDAAAAVVVSRARVRGRRRDALTDANTADHMTWEVTDLGSGWGCRPGCPMCSRSTWPAWSTTCSAGTACSCRRGRVGGAPGRAEDP